VIPASSFPPKSPWRYEWLVRSLGWREGTVVIAGIPSSGERAWGYTNGSRPVMALRNRRPQRSNVCKTNKEEWGHKIGGRVCGTATGEAAAATRSAAGSHRIEASSGISKRSGHAYIPSSPRIAFPLRVRCVTDILRRRWKLPSPSRTAAPKRSEKPMEWQHHHEDRPAEGPAKGSARVRAAKGKGGRHTRQVGAGYLPP